MNNPLKYSNCWEDAFLLGNHLNVHAESRVMSVASGGDNSLYLLQYAPAEMLCIDLNEIQLFVTQFKESAIRMLEYSDFLALLGFVEHPNRQALYQKIKPDLPQKAQDFFESHFYLIDNKIIHQGKFEHYFQLFSGRILPLIHNSKKVAQLFKNKSEQEQNDFYKNLWDTWRWRLLFKIFFSRFVMGKWGREPEKLKHVKGTVGNKIYQMAGRHLADRHCQHNYILTYCLTGNFGNNLPPYARPEIFEKTKNWLSENRIKYSLCSLQEAVANYPNYTRFNLSNIFEYMTDDEFNQNIQTLTKHSASGSIICYWNLMVERIISHTEWKEKEHLGNDLGFFYQKFNVFEK
ncbi:MAG: DUF3419 family protein [Flavobacteriales bacterium]|nr:DUF3419 family protein [Flavobacteriales bacterium]